MMKNLLLILLLFIGLGLNAQLTFSPDPAISSGYISQSDIELDIHLKNEFAEDISINWNIKSNSNETPEEWEFQVCDLWLCYDPNITMNDPSKPSELMAGQEGTFTFHTLPHGTDGVGGWNLSFTNADTDELLLTIPITSDVLFTSTFELSIDDIKLFPNPTVDYFQLSHSQGISKLSIFNIVGKEMKTYNVTEGANYDISNLPNGMYIVRLFDNDNQVAKVVRVSKR